MMRMLFTIKVIKYVKQNVKRQGNNNTSQFKQPIEIVRTIHRGYWEGFAIRRYTTYFTAEQLKYPAKK